VVLIFLLFASLLVYQYRRTSALVDLMHKKCKSYLNHPSNIDGIRLDVLRECIFEEISESGVAWRPALAAVWPRVEACLRKDLLLRIWHSENLALRIEEEMIQSISPKLRRNVPQDDIYQRNINPIHYPQYNTPIKNDGTPSTYSH
jgi:hypothetical protein